MTIDVTAQDYELLSQYLDRELTAIAAQQLEQRLRIEPALNVSFLQLQALQTRLQHSVDTVGTTGIPGHITALLQAEPLRIVPLPHRRTMGWSYALAASLVIAASGALISQWGQLSGQSDPDAALWLALDNSPSRSAGWESLADGRQIRPVLSFEHKSGDWCREYLLTDNDGSWHGVACRGDDGWATTALVATDIPGSPGEYRPAGANDSVEVVNFIDQNAAGIPLDANQEAAMIAQEWR